MPAFIPANNAIEAAISIAVLVIAFIGWIAQIVGQAKGQQAGPQNRPRPAMPRAAGGPGRAKPDERLRGEIDAFLREVAGNAGRPAPQEEVALEVLPDDEEETPRRLVTAGTRPRPATVPQPGGSRPSESRPVVASVGQMSEWDREQARRREQLQSNLSDRHLDSTALGRDLRQHVEQFAAESRQLRQEKEQVERRLAEARAELQSMRAQVAAGPAAVPVAAKTAGATSTGARFATLLKNRKSVKDAIIVNEVLGRPKGMRPRA